MNEICPSCGKTITQKNAGGTYWSIYGGILCADCEKSKKNLIEAMYENGGPETKYLHEDAIGHIETKKSVPQEGEFAFVYYSEYSPIPLEINIKCDKRNFYNDQLVFKWSVRPLGKYDNSYNTREEVWKIRGRFREKPKALKNTAKEISEVIPFEYKEIIEALILIDAEIARVEMFKEINAEDEERKKEDLSEAEKEEALRLLKDEGILPMILQVQAHRLVGEEEAVLMTYLALMTAKLPPRSRVGTQLTGSSSGGKTHVARTALQLYPEESVVDFTRMSPTAMEHADGIDWDHKILFTAEAGGAEASIEVLKHFTDDSGHGAKLFTVEKDENTNEYKSVLKESKGKPAFLTTTAKVIEDFEFLNRLLTIPINLSKEQTQKVVDFKTIKASMPWKFKSDEKWKEVYRNCYRLLEEKPIVVPYATALTSMIDYGKIKSRRDIDKVIWLIKASALLHQYQRARVEVDGKEYVIANFQDLVNAMKIGKKAFKRTFENLHESTHQMMEVIKEKGDELKIRNIKDVGDWGFTVQDLLQATREHGWTKGFIYKHLRSLSDVGFLSKTRLGRENVYWVVSNSSLKEGKGLSPLELVNVALDSMDEYMESNKLLFNGSEVDKKDIDRLIEILNPKDMISPFNTKQLLTLNDLTEEVNEWIDFDKDIYLQVKDYERKELMDMEQMQESAIKKTKIVQESAIKKTKTIKQILQGLQKENDKVTEDELIETAKEFNIEKEEVNLALKELKKKGEVYSPRHGELCSADGGMSIDEWSL